MSFYGGGNGFYSDYQFPIMDIGPLNVALNTVAATKREDSNLYTIIGTHNQVKTATKLEDSNIYNINGARNLVKPIIKREDSNIYSIVGPNNQEVRKKGPCIVSLSNALPQFKGNQIAPVQEINEHTQVEEEDEAQPELDIIVNNVVATFNTKCHLNLRQIALNGSNVEYIRDMQVVVMKFRNPKITAKVYSSGKVICTGATSNEDAKRAARKVARSLQKLGFKIRFTEYKIVNVLCTCYMYFGINLNKFTQKHRLLTSYEPELHPGATYKVKDLKATLKLYTTGSITITAPSTDNIQRAVEHIFPLVYEFRTAKPPSKKSQYHNYQMSRKAKGVFQDGFSSSEDDSYLQSEW
ncbi:TATA box-binding protein-like 1 [Parasteatoda tepidariorum]|uniref:TATA box-binding protein-like 1 n=1 Tax=Parasteatoda tepidariorum TaxID=114398 RepID=UPI001C725C22|nr:TATA box-binding protein-like 1 [Parasteatoda tepidariorum]